MKRARFGASSEKLDERVEQLELAIEMLETDAAERLGAEAVEVRASGWPAGLARTPAARERGPCRSLHPPGQRRGAALDR
ncbi:transposase domain-containing protein [Methylorubrum sp. GM97]|uniref:transposase domain-containing protein n=1 Tax=Methylorubrum sp. GM97 TaxID=2938232 RepID=UPI003965C837